MSLKTIVKVCNAGESLGLIAPDSDGPDLLVHPTALALADDRKNRSNKAALLERV